MLCGVYNASKWTYVCVCVPPRMFACVCVSVFVSASTCDWVIECVCTIHCSGLSDSLWICIDFLSSALLGSLLPSPLSSLPSSLPLYQHRRGPILSLFHCSSCSINHFAFSRWRETCWSSWWKRIKQDLMALQELDAEHFTGRSAFLLFHFYQVVHNC